MAIGLRCGWVISITQYESEPIYWGKVNCFHLEQEKSLFIKWQFITYFRTEYSSVNGQITQ